jgi:hypothetical protein
MCGEDMNDAPNLPKHFGEIRMLSKKKRGMKKPVKKTCKNCGDMACLCKDCTGNNCRGITGNYSICTDLACDEWRKKA